MRVWKSIVDNAIDHGDEVSEWITTHVFLSAKKARLVFMSQATVRMCNPDTTKSQVSFADGYPYLIASTASLRDLNKRIMQAGGTPVPMTRFRPNIVLDGLHPWTEDTDGALVKLSPGYALRILKGCDRCKVTTIDQIYGTVSKEQEPLKTLRTFRKIKNTVDVYFATNAELVRTVSGDSSPFVITHGEVEMEWFPK